MLSPIRKKSLAEPFLALSFIIMVIQYNTIQSMLYGRKFRNHLVKYCVVLRWGPKDPARSYSVNSKNILGSVGVILQKLEDFPSPST